MTKNPVGVSQNVRMIGRTDLPGGGQVVVQDGVAYVGHMDPPDGTTLLDVSDPKNPKVLSRIEVPMNTHSHKARVRGDVMVVNYEAYGKDRSSFQGGVKVFDVSDPRAPREIAFFAVPASGVHRFDMDDRYLYLSAEAEGYVGNIVRILDLADPTKPQEVGRWWLPGQWAEGGEPCLPDGRESRCHHPLRCGDRLYVSYWHAGFVILDVSDLGGPRFVSRLDWSPPYPCPTHTAMRIPQKLKGRDFRFVADEEVPSRLAPSPNAFVWMVDVTEEARPVPVSTWRVPHAEPFDPNRERFGAHQPQEQMYGEDVVAVAWFAGGVRFLDISNPYRLEEVGFYVPFPGKGYDVVQSNDVFVDPSGLVYLIDRFNGLEILELTA
ncbi:MAG: hypothetical protein V3T44_03005 [bacterium]